MNMQKHEEVLERLGRKATDFHSTFKTTVGRRVLQGLEEEFDRLNIMSETPEMTAYKLGQRDVVMYIKQLISHAEKIHNAT